MAAPKPPPAPRRGLLAILAILVLAGLGAVVYVYRPKGAERIDVPPVATDGIEAPVATAIKRARDEVVEDPHAADKWGRVGLVLFANDLDADSWPWLQRAEQLAPRDPRWPYYLGLALLVNRPEDAADAIRRAAELSPGDADVRLRLADVLFSIDRIEEADAAFGEVLRARPNDPRALLGRGRVLLRRGKAAEAVPLLERVAAHPTARKTARTALAEAHARLGDEKATAEQHRLADASPSDAPWPDEKTYVILDLQVALGSRLRRIESAVAAGQLRQAFALLEQTLRDRPDSSEAHFAFGKTLVRAGRPGDAEAALGKSIELDAAATDSHALLGALRMQRGDVTGAEQCFRKVLGVRPGDALAHFNVSQCRVKQGDTAGAVAALKDAIRYRSGLAPAHQSLGELHLEAGRLDEALTCLEAAVRLDPQNEKARTLLQQAQTRQKRK